MQSEDLNELSGKIIGACIEVHKHLGPGLFEKIYQHFVAWELRQQGLHVEVEYPVPVAYKGMPHALGYRADLLVENTVIVEFKVHELNMLHKAQVLTYLKLTGKPLGILANFNVLRIKDGGIKRVLNDSHELFKIRRGLQFTKLTLEEVEDAEQLW